MIHLIGAGGHGKVVAEVLRAQGHGIIPLDKTPLPGAQLAGTPVHEEQRILDSLLKPAPFFVAIGDALSRQVVTERWLARGHHLVTAIHPAAIVSPSAHLQAGSCIMAGAIVQTDASVGRSAIVNTGAVLDHDCRLGEYAHVAPGCQLAGAVSVGARSWIGIGTTVIEGVRIGRDSLVGAGSVVLKDVPADVVAYGQPCRVVRNRQAHPVPTPVS